MRKSIFSFVQRAITEQSGQTLPFVALAMTALLGVGGLVVDVGHAYVVRTQLQNSANAAALAASGLVYDADSNSVNSTSQATQYGSTGTENPVTFATAAPTITKVCVNVLLSTGSCTTSSPANAIRVTETAAVPTFLMGLFGVPKLNVSATAVASMQGAAQPWNVAIVLDSTGSMTLSDSNCGSGQTEFTCATTAIQAFLGGASPCAAGYTSCATSHANLHVALFSFPAVSAATVVDETTNCTTPTFMGYPLPLASATSYTPASYKITKGSTTTTVTPTYEVVPFSSDYYSASASNHLNSSSTLAKTVTNCIAAMPLGNQNTGAGGITDPTSNNAGLTYFASAMYAAQSALVAQSAAEVTAGVTGTKNAIIFLSDGQANMNETNDFLVTQSGETVALATGSTGNLAFTGTGKYPDLNDQCQQAITAAQVAAAAGTRVYAVSYGAETDGCTYKTGTSGTEWSLGTDNTTVATATGTNAAISAATVTPCLTMENIAQAEVGNSAPSTNYFYSDYAQTNSGTGPDANCTAPHSVTTLSSILLAVLADFTHPRLLSSTGGYTVVTAQ